MNFQNIFEKVISGEHLTSEEASFAMESIMSGDLSSAKIAGFLVSLRMKGETPVEISEFAKVMREKSTRVTLEKDPIDMCGTGGDGLWTFNISTLASLVVASCGVPVAKHGNRSVSSSCGSADLLEALGVKIDLAPDEVRRSVEELGFGFIFAPLYHPAMKNVAPVRRELGIRTVFNILGPLTNPAIVKRQVIGVFSREYQKKIADALEILGVEKAFVLHGGDGSDEASVSSTTFVIEIGNEKRKTYEIYPEFFGIKNRANIEDLKVNSKEEAKNLAMSVLAGEIEPHTSVVALNAAFGLVVGKAEVSLKDAYNTAIKTLKSGKTLSLLENLKNTFPISNS